MKHLITVAFLLGSFLSAHADETLSFCGSKIDGVRVKYKYPLAKVHKLPEWDMKGDTPFPFDKAMKKAWAYAEKKFPDVDLFLEEVEMDPRGYPVDVAPRHKKICWVYRFEFCDFHTGKDVPGIIIMLMDGTILEPTPEVKH